MSTFIENHKVCLHWEHEYCSEPIPAVPAGAGESRVSGGGRELGWRWPTGVILSTLRAPESRFQDQYDFFSPQPIFSITHVFLLYYLELRPSKSTIFPQILHFTNIIQLPPLLSNHSLFPNLDYLILALVLLHCEVRKTVSGRQT